jgi:hypothetical protein
MNKQFKDLNKVLQLTINNNYAVAKRKLSEISREELSDSSKKTYDKVSEILSRKDITHAPKSNVSVSANIPKTKMVYCILAMEHETDVLKMTVSPLIQQLDESDSIYILFNGFNDFSLKTHFEKHTGIHVWESTINQGVAGGRNFLYEKSFGDLKGFDYIITLDNDVIVPNDFNAVIKNELEENYVKHNVGILGSVILDYKKQKVKNFVTDNYLSFPGYLSATNYNIFTDDINDFIKKNTETLDTILWHIGIEKNYMDAYVNRKDLHQNFNNEKQTYFPFLAHAPCNKELIYHELFEVSNVPGCFQAISTKNLKKAGLLENKFSPYFFEDSEFSIRLMRMGLKNFISTKISLFHGTDDRHNDRKKINSKFEFITNEYRARIILLDKLKIANPIRKLVTQSIYRYSLDNNKAKALPEFIAALVGLRRGMMQLGMTTHVSDNNEAEMDSALIDKVITSKLIGENNNGASISFDESLPTPDKNLPQVYFSQLKKFRNIYEGQDCLIVCNGPSLKDTNLGLFKNMPTFFVNSTFILQNSLGITPDFYTVEDNHVIDDNIQSIKSMNSGVKFFPDKYRAKFGDEKDVYYLPTVWDCYWKSKLSHEYPEFSEDIARGIYTGQTVTYLNLQLAYYMGFKRVFIVGLDFSYSIPKGSKIDNNSIDHDDDDPNHFHANYFGKGRQWHFPKLDSCMVSYSIAKERFERSNREVIDLTKNGCLNVFRKSTVAEELNLEHHYSSLYKGLDFKQYLIDLIYVKYIKPTNIINNNWVLQEKEFEFTVDSNTHTNIWINDKYLDYCNSLLTAISEATTFEVLAYVNENIYVTTNIIECYELPFCNWLSSQVNIKHVELPNFHKESLEYLSNEYVLYLPNNDEGRMYLRKALPELRQEKIAIFANNHKILIKYLNQ